MENTRWKKLGQRLFIFGLSLLLDSWFVERGLTEHYHSRLDEIARTGDRLSQDSAQLKLDRLFVQLDRFRYEVRQVEVMKFANEHPQRAKRSHADELVRGFEAKQSDLNKKAEAQVQSMVDNMLNGLPTLVPEAADDLRKAWDD